MKSLFLEKNDEVSSLEVPVIKNHKGSNVVTQTAVTHKDSGAAVTHKDLEKKPTITHKEEKIALILSLTGIFTVWYLFQ